MSSRHYPIRIGRRSAPLLRIAFGVTPDRAWATITDGTLTPDRAWATITDGTLVARFGRFELRVPVSSIARWRIEGPWRWITAIGVRRSVRHGDFSFAGSPRGGVRLDFVQPIRWSGLRVPAFYLGVEELEAFAAELTSLGIPGEDGRTAR